MQPQKRPRREPILDRCYLRPRGILSISPDNHNRQLTDLPRGVVYNDMPSVEIELTITPTMETRRQADSLWPQLALGGRKLPDKQQFFHYLFNAGKRAWHQRGVVRYPTPPIPRTSPYTLASGRRSGAIRDRLGAGVAPLPDDPADCVVSPWTPRRRRPRGGPPWCSPLRPTGSARRARSTGWTTCRCRSARRLRPAT